MLTRAALPCALGLLAQQPETEIYNPGRMVSIVSRPDIPSYEYTVFYLQKDAFTGASEELLRLHQNTDVKFVIKDGYLYFIDEDGKAQRTRFIKQANVRQAPVPVK